MSAELVAEKLGRFTNRRRMLGRVGTAAVGSVLLLLGRSPAEAEACCCSTHGCDLCACETGCIGYACSWCWWGSCVNHKRYLCCEGFSEAGACYDGCGNQWYCSFLGGSQSC